MGVLAINGGQKLRTVPFSEWPLFDDNDKTRLLEVLESRKWGTLGPKTLEFEKKFASYLGAGHVQTATNGTATLEIILRAMNIGAGDEVVIPPYTFIATASAVLMAGAIPVFADIEYKNNCIDPESVEKVITDKTKAIIPVHMAGFPADMDRLMAISEKYNIPIIEDAAQAHGSEWRGKKIGTLGIAGSFSFQLSKNMSAGEGGAISTNDQELADMIWSIHHVGRKKDGAWYGHYHLSGNYRLTDWQSVVLLSQLERLDGQIDTREKNVKILNQKLSEIPGLSIFERDERATRITHHLYMFRYHKEQFNNLPKVKFVEALIAEGIPAHTGYTPIQKQPLFEHEQVKKIVPDGSDYAGLSLPVADKACEETVWITQNVLLGTEEDCEQIAEAIRKVLDNRDEIK